MSWLTIFISAMMSIVDHLSHYTEDTPATFQPLLIHIVMASNIVAVSNVYLYLIFVVALNWDHDKLYILVKRNLVNSSVNDDHQFIDIKDSSSTPSKKKKYEIQREYFWQYVVVWFARIMMILLFTTLFISSLCLIGYLAKKKVLEVKSRPDYHEYD